MGEGSGPRVAVIGAGAWGTTLARLIARVEPVTLWCHSEATAERIRSTGRNETRLPGIDLPGSVVATADPAALAEATDLVLFAAPSAHLRGVVEIVAPHLAPSADRLSVTKGLERETLLRMSQVIEAAGGAPSGRVAAQSGPNLAVEVARNLPTSGSPSGSSPGSAGAASGCT
jgi:glycerol-3-phosphate dehydrogenase (NAD(P)+)